MADRCLYNAKLAEQAERFDDMCDWMTQCVTLKQGNLTDEERSALSVAFKNSVGARRASWRVIAAAEARAKADFSENARLAVRLREQVESEIRALCMNMLNMLDTRLIPTTAQPSGKVQLLKMRGDYYRYLAEISSDASIPKKALEAYEEASAIAEVSLDVADAARLALALNRSVFYFEILQDKENACRVARTAYEAATAAAEDKQRESALALQLLRDNLALWTSGAIS